MSGPVTPAGHDSAKPSKSGRAIKIALALSLSLNLAVAGVVAGAALRARGDDGMGRMGGRDLNFGAFSQALTRDQRRGMMGRLGDDGLGLREMRTQMRGDMAAVLTALRAQPFDPSGVEVAFAQQNTRLTARAEAGRKALVGLILAMSDVDRAAFTERLEQAVTRRPVQNGKRS